VAVDGLLDLIGALAGEGQAVEAAGALEKRHGAQQNGRVAPVADDRRVVDALGGELPADLGAFRGNHRRIGRNRHLRGHLADCQGYVNPTDLAALKNDVFGYKRLEPRAIGSQTIRAPL